MSRAFLIALISLFSCLGVSDDASARMSFDECMNRARGNDADVEHKSLAAVETICTLIAKSWNDRQSGEPLIVEIEFVDGDCTTEKNHRREGVISGLVLARLLKTQGLLPPDRPNGLKLCGLDIGGPLDLGGSTLTYPLSFKNVYFNSCTLRNDDGNCGEGDSLRVKQSRLKDLRIEGAQLDGLITIEQSSLDGSLALIETEAKGVRLRDVTILGGLILDDAILGKSREGVPSLEAVGLNARGNVAFRDSFFADDVTLSRLQLRHFEIDNSDIAGAFAVDSSAAYDMHAPLDMAVFGASFGDSFDIRLTSFGTLELMESTWQGYVVVENNRADHIIIKDNNFNDTIYINYNTVQKDLQILNNLIDLLSPIGALCQRLTGGDDSVWCGDRDPEIASNKVAGRFFFEIEDLNPGVRRIDVTFNRVSGLASIQVPDYWHGHIDLSNIRAEARLEIGKPVHVYDERQRHTANLIYPDLAGDEIENLGEYCSESQFIGFNQLEEESATSEPETKSLLINLTNARARVLAWNLPLICRYRWIGAALSFDYWGDPDLKSETIKTWQQRSEAQFLGAFEIWRYTMAQKRPETLSALADYLHTRGRFSRSRDIREEAKALNYRPAATGLLSAMAASLDHAFDWASSFAFIAGLGKSLGQLTDWLAYIYLWPAGFGAKPERAMICLFVMVLVGWGIYAAYRSKAAPPDEDDASDKTQFLYPTLANGFYRYDKDKAPQEVNLFVFSLDASIPLLDLKAHSHFYPRSRRIRALTVIQHVFGWWFITVFIGAAAIL